MEYKYFSQEFARKILEYKDNRKELLEKLKRAVKKANCKFPLYRKKMPEDISPFSAMGIVLRQRVFEKLLPYIKEEFNIETGYNYNFWLPLQLTMQAYLLTEDDNKPQLVWDFFEIVINYVDNPDERQNFIQYYDKCINVKGLKWCLAYCLYWVEPDFYVPLDGNCRNYLLKNVPDLISEYDNLKKPLTGYKYLDLIDKLNDKIKTGETEFKSFPDISRLSYAGIDKNENLEDNVVLENNEENINIKYWLFSPGHNAEKWDEFYNNGIIGLGWDYLGNHNNYESINEILQALGDNHRTNNANTIWNFAKVMSIGDVIYVKSGMSEIIGKGEVISDYIFDNKRESYKSIRKVKWLNKGNWKVNKMPVKTITDITQNTERIKEIENVINANADNDNFNFKPENIIFYGVPGCGKSHYIKNTYIQKYADLESNWQIVRTVFHPDYTYSDFVGQILPKTENKNVTYEFKPGPFTKILKSAYENPDCAYYLIIEEINRGNAPAIFGDIFQLLDRTNTGESEYSIENEDIAKSILYNNNKENVKINDKNLKDELKKNQIKIPGNLTLVATMNTSDQNVFTLDTAFQRRWNMRLIRNEFGGDGIEKLYVPGTATTWGEFWKKINDKIVENNNGLSSEDKRLGTHFVKESDLAEKENDPANTERFAEKVFRYLWDDVFKMDKSKVFKDKINDKVLNTLEAVLGEFETNHKLKNIFKDIDFKDKNNDSSPENENVEEQ